jgi:hypothetical protein
MVNVAIANGEIRKVEPLDIFLNIVTLTLSAFIVAPMGFAINECDTASRKEYIDHRKNDIKKLVINGLKAN